MHAGTFGYTANRKNIIQFIKNPGEGFSRGKKNSLCFDNFKPEKILNLLPKNFTLTTKNSSAHFNKFILVSTSSVLFSLGLKDPTISQYHIDIDDNTNVLGKFEDLYQGKLVVFTEEELPISKQITKALIIRSCPNYMKPESLKFQEDERIYKIGLQSGVGIDKTSFYSFIKQDNVSKFKIITNTHEYMCNKYGVFTSHVINELLTKDPTITEYKYDFSDENNEFQLICDLFNFNTVTITPNNMYSLKEMAEDLQIDLILPCIEDNINNNEKITETIDELQATIDLNEELFQWLYNIDKLNVKTVKNSIADSIWSRSEDNVNELSLCFINVINTSFDVHPYLIDLIFLFKNESNKLNTFIQFFKNNIKLSFGKNFANCSFIYNLYKKGFFDENELIEYIENFISRERSTAIEKILYWFLPELIEHGIVIEIDIEQKVIKFKNSWIMLSEEAIEFVKLYYNKDNFDLYKQMRDKNQHEDTLTKALYEDDVNKVQSILSSINTDFSKYTLPFSIFENDICNGRTTLINYAAAHGSIKCFKYLLLNHSTIDDLTYNYAVCGGNTEIIMIVERQNTNQPTTTKTTTNRKPQMNKKIPECKNAISFAIAKHKNDLFDYIFEQKYLNNDIQNNDFLQKSNELLKESIENGNAHSLVELINKSASSCDFICLIQLAARCGYYRLTKIIYNIMKERMAEFSISSYSNLEHFQIKKSNSSSSTIAFNDSFSFIGNLSIFKIGIQFFREINHFEGNLIYSISKGYKRIFDYFFNKLFKDSIELTNSLVAGCFQEALKNESNYYFNRLIEEIKNIDPYFFFQYDNIQITLILCCQSKNIEYFTTIYNIAKEYKLSWSDNELFLNAVKYGAIEICQYYFDNKIKISFQNIVSNIANIGSIKKEIFLLIINNTNDEIKNMLLSWSLYPSIQQKNKELVEFLLSKNVVPNDDALIVAVITNDIDIVKTILKFKNDPLFINKRSKDGTALLIATNQNSLKIVKRLLEIPGIDPGLYDEKDQTPLICSIVNFNLEIMNAILDFYGENIQSQTWQLEKAIQMALNILSPSYYKQNKIISRSSINESSNNKRKKQLLLILKRILEIKNIDPNCHNGEHTLLSYACESNEISIVQMLLKTEKVDINAYVPLTGNTPLMIAICNNNVEIAKLLINDKRTNINHINYENQTSLTIAVKNNLDEIIDLLMKNESFNPEQSRLNDALFISNGDIAKILLNSKFADVNYRHSYTISKENSRENYYDFRYESILNNAVLNMDFKKIDLLIQHPLFDKVKSLLYKSIFELIKLKTRDPDSVKLEIFKLLIKSNDNDPNICDVDNSSLLISSVKMLNTLFITEILENANFDSQKSNIVEAFNIAYTNNYKSFELIYEYDKNHDHLIDLNKLLPNGRSYFTVSVTNNSEKLDFLLENGADPNISDQNEINPLEFAIYYSIKPVISALLNSGKVDLLKQIKIKNKNIINQYKLSNNNYYSYAFPHIEMNPKSKVVSFIHLAAAYGNKILKSFLETKLIDINAKDDQGETPLMVACRNRQKYNIIALFDYQDQELDYLHCNADGDDALKIINADGNPKNKNEYKEALISVLSDDKPKSNAYFSFK